ncbi:MAG: phosphonate metabolism protein/1,5-bisphosphokinase (PRPP-forming) PhnN [Pseudomonadota bacterium]
MNRTGTRSSSVGRFIAVVGPSGVGKDSVMEALCAAVPTLSRVHRVITRAPDAGGEDYESVDAVTFAAMAERGAFALWWHAHGLSYGIPKSVGADLQQGRDVLANLSRSKLGEANAMFSRFVTLSIAADADVLAARLIARGRESDEDQAKRLARASFAMPDDVPVVTVNNSGRLEDTVAACLDVLGYTDAPNATSATA